MRNYMKHIIATQDYRSRYYKPDEDKHILDPHVVRFFRVRGYPSIEDVWSTRESLKEISAATESMPKSAFGDIDHCLHFAYDWEEADGVYWSDTYLDDKVDSTDTAPHRAKF